MESIEEDEIIIIKEKDFKLTSDKNTDYIIKLSIDENNLFNITAITTNNILLKKKYSLSLSMDDLNRHRFFKIFLNTEEIFRELENKIENSTIIEEPNILYLDIPIGLTVINDITLEIKEKEKSKDDIIEELKNELNYKNDLIIQKDNKIKEIENELNENKIKLNNEIQTLKDKIENKINFYKNKFNNFKQKKEKLIKKEINTKEINDIIQMKSKENVELIHKIINYENIIEIELETNKNNEEIKIINNNLFNKNNTILFINNEEKVFNNTLKLKKKDKYKLLIFNISKIENLKEFFKGCENIKKIKFYKFNTENVSDMSSMFSDCSSLISIDVSNFNTKNVENMNNMFSNCSSLNSIDISNFNVENVQKMDSMFNGCLSLNSIEVSNFNIEMFQKIYDKTKFKLKI